METDYQLAFELAHLRRFRFGATSEAFSGEQRSLFEEDLDQDLAAVEAEMAAEETAADPVSRPASRRPHPGQRLCVAAAVTAMPAARTRSGDFTPAIPSRDPIPRRRACP